MGKQVWKPGNMLYPVPAVLVSCGDEKGFFNLFTAAWAGTVCSDPAMVSISVKPSRFSHDLIRDTGEFVVNLTTEDLAFQTDFCGVKSGRDTDKWKEAGLTPEKAVSLQYAPIVKESPVSIECTVRNILPLGSHDMFIGEVKAVQIDEKYLDEKGRFDLNAAKLIAYSHGEYRGLSETIGTYGFSVRKKTVKGKKKHGEKR